MRFLIDKNKNLHVYIGWTQNRLLLLRKDLEETGDRVPKCQLYIKPANASLGTVTKRTENKAAALM